MAVPLAWPRDSFGSGRNKPSSSSHIRNNEGRSCCKHLGVYVCGDVAGQKPSGAVPEREGTSQEIRSKATVICSIRNEKKT